MPNYRRYYVPGGTYFFTVVTHQRRHFLTDEGPRTLFRDAIQKVKAERPFTLFASVLLPDHFHCVWVLPPGDDNYSLRWAQIKEEFTRTFLKVGGQEGRRTNSRDKHRERAIWQRRFWEHTVRDEDDLIRCVDYIHWNPVKHGYVRRPAEWPWSSFHRFVQSGVYPASWGEVETILDVPGAEWE
jgi:putative transposase